MTTSVTGGHGTILPASGEVDDDSLVHLTTVPEEGYRAIAWTGTYNDDLATRDNYVLMDTDKTVTVEFEPIPPSIPSETRVETVNDGYFTNNEWVYFASSQGDNLFLEQDGTLHMAIVDNYELWYYTSADHGVTWTKTNIATGLNGTVRYAVMTVDGNGHVFIGCTANPAYDYGQTGTGTGTDAYRYDVWTVDNTSGSWGAPVQHFDSTSGYGFFVSGMFVDASDNIHLIATRYGWNAAGGTAQEWVRDSESGAWTEKTAAHFSGTNKIIRWYTPSVVKTDGDIVTVMKRNTSSADELFYVVNSEGAWGTPHAIDSDNNLNWAGQSTFDTAIDSDDNIYLVFFDNNAASQTEVKFSEDLGATTEVIYTGDAGQAFYDVKVHVDKEGNVTVVIRRQGDSTLLLIRLADGSWQTPAPLPSSAPDGDVWQFMVPRTATFDDVFTGFKLAYFDTDIANPPKPSSPPYGPYGPHYLYYNNLANTATSRISSGSGTMIPDGSRTVLFGETLHYILEPAVGYHMLRVEGSCPEGTLVDNGDGTFGYTTGPIVFDCTVEVLFEINTYEVTAEAGENGSLDAATPSPQQVTHGDNVDFTFNADEHYFITSIKGCGIDYTWTNSDNQHETLTLSTAPVIEPCTVTAEFALHRFTVTTNVGEGGYLDSSTPEPPPISVDYGSTLSFRFNADSGYHITTISSDCGVDYTAPDNLVDTQEVTTAAITADCIVTATFAPHFMVTGTAGANGSLDSSTPSPQRVDTGDTATFTFNAEEHYHVAAVSGCGISYNNSSNLVISYTATTDAVSSDCEVEATFAINVFALEYFVLPGADGSLAGETSQIVEYGASGTAVTAVPDTGYHFVQWDDGSKANPRTDANVTENIVVTASFEPGGYTLTYTAGENGSISGPALQQNVAHGDDGEAVTAVPDDHYRFAGWSDGVKEATRQDLNVMTDITVEASFEPDFPWTMFMPAIITGSR